MNLPTRQSLASHIDHLVVTAPTLEAGVEFVHDALGVAMQPGGEHVRMGTHNRLLKLGDAVFLEVIAINPAAQRPARPRWFELDRNMHNVQPRLATWVVQTNDIKTAALAAERAAASAALPALPGVVTPMSRGQLAWLITIPDDGSLPLQGIAPTVIEWPAGQHPAAGLRDMGCSLVALEGAAAAPQKITAILQAIGFRDAFALVPLASHRAPYLSALIQTPHGLRRLGGPPAD